MGGMTAIADRYRTLADAFEAKVAAVAPDDWSNPSPCERVDRPRRSSTTSSTCTG